MPALLNLYRLLSIATAPLVLWRLQRGASARPELRGRWRERLGRWQGNGGGGIWVHAASAGEVNAVAPLIRALLDRRPGLPVLVSTQTHTGAGRVEAQFGSSVRHRFAPLDTPGAVSRWLDRARPELGLIAETELWPELFCAAGARDVPLALVSARISARAFGRYRRFAGLFRHALDAVQLACCQSTEDAARLRELGLPAERIHVSGNVKFDLSPPADLDARADALRRLWGVRPAWVAGSTHAGEEEVLIDAHRRLVRTHPGALLVLAPRHPERAGQAARVIERAGLGWCGPDQRAAPRISVVLVDRLGLLMPCYRAAAVCFVGGSLAPVGGHNLLEPALAERPVLTGPHLHDQADLAAALDAENALVRVAGAGELASTVAQLWDDPARARDLGRAGARVVRSNRGALERTLTLLEPMLSGATGY